MVRLRKCGRLLLWTGAGLGLIGPAAAHADVRFNGFGQIVVGSALGNDNPFPARNTLAAYGADPQFQNESLFGLQAQTQLYNDVTATAQIVASGEPSDLVYPEISYNCAAEGISGCHFQSQDFQPKFTWAYATWAINDSLALTAGRQRLPLYHYSDYLQVGEAYPWIRPPVSVYAAPISDYDGISLRGHYSVGNWYLQPQAFYGSFDGDIFLNLEKGAITLNNLSGAVFEANYNDWFDFRLSYASAWLDVNYPQVQYAQSQQYEIATIEASQLAPAGLGVEQILSSPNTQQALAAAGYTPQQIAGWIAGLNDFGKAAAGYESVANDAEVKGAYISYSSAGIEVNKYNFLFDAEYIYQKSPGWVNSLASYYLSLGYHFGRLTPMLTYGRTDVRDGSQSVASNIRHNDEKAYQNDTASTAGYDAACSAIQVATGSSCSQLSEQLGFPSSLPNSMTGLTPAGTVLNPVTNETAADLLFLSDQVLANYPNDIDDYYEAGLRYDLTRSTALKLDYTYYASPQSGSGPTGPHPEQGPSHGQLVSAGFVFAF